jgi:hypothetical protein
MPAIELVATRAEQPLAQHGTDLVAYFVPIGAFILKRSDGRWDINHPVTSVAARQHLLEQGLDPDVVKGILKDSKFRRVYGVDTEPGEAAEFERNGEVLLNSYVPPGIVPLAGEWPTIREIREVITGDDCSKGGLDYIDSWAALKVQCPARRSMTALVLQGPPGIGKTLFGRILAEIIGVENCASIGQAALESRFNTSFIGKLLVVADEVFDRENAVATANALKKYVTDHRLVVNGKNVKEYAIQNRMSWVFTSNNSVPVRIEGKDDRRYTVLLGRAPCCPGYKDRLSACFQGNEPSQGFRVEIAAYAHYLRNFDVDVGLISRPFQNEARLQVALASRSSVEAFIDEIEDRGSIDALVFEWGTSMDLDTVFYRRKSWDFEAGIECQIVYKTYRHFCNERGFRGAVADQNLGRQLRILRPEWRRVRLGSGGRPYIYSNLPRDRTVWGSEPFPEPEAGAVSAPAWVAEQSGGSSIPVTEEE